MKPVFFAFVALLASTQAMATSLHPDTFSHVILEKINGGGFGQRYFTKLSVATSGEVVLTTVDTFSTEQASTEQLVLKLNGQVVNNLEKMISTISKEELQDSSPGQPGCQDAPTTTYLITKGSESIKIGQGIMCKSYEHSSSNAKKLVNVLESLDHLSNYSFVK